MANRPEINQKNKIPTYRIKRGELMTFGGHAVQVIGVKRSGGDKAVIVIAGSGSDMCKCGEDCDLQKYRGKMYCKTCLDKKLRWNR